MRRYDSVEASSTASLDTQTFVRIMRSYDMDEIAVIGGEGMNDEKAKMLKITTDRIEQKFGRGSIMKLGEGASTSTSASFPPGHCRSTQPSESEACLVAASSRFTALNHRARQPLPSRFSPKPKRWAVWSPSSTPSMRSTLCMLHASVSTSTRCSFPSLTRASKRSKSAICSCAPVQSMPS